MTEPGPGLVDRFVAKGSRVALGVLGAVVAALGAWAAVSLEAEGQEMPTRYGAIWLVGLGLTAISFAWREPKRVFSLSWKARVLSLACLTLACASCFAGFLLAVAVGVGGEFDSGVPWLLLGGAVLLGVVVPVTMLKLGARYRPAAEIEETRKKLF